VRETGQRVDTWLWHARLFKTRTLAAAVVSAGKVRLTRNGSTARIAKTSHQVRPGDTLTFPKGKLIRIVKIEALATRRGPAPEAQGLYEDLTPPPTPKAERPAKPASREPGSGRPTKKDRRALDKLRGLDHLKDKKV
jgi:ribosome-associated heat shock protein Hsp15